MSMNFNLAVQKFTELTDLTSEQSGRTRRGWQNTALPGNTLVDVLVCTVTYKNLSFDAHAVWTSSSTRLLLEHLLWCLCWGNANHGCIHTAVAQGESGSSIYSRVGGLIPVSPSSVLQIASDVINIYVRVKALI